MLSLFISFFLFSSGKVPSWLFNRMKNLAREITIAVVIEFGPQEMLRVLSDSKSSKVLVRMP